VALLEARMSRELAGLVTRNGGIPISVPAVREVSLPCTEDVRALLDEAARGAFAYVILMTGVGTTAFFDEAERLGRAGELLSMLERAVVVCRGPKPSAVLKRRGVAPAISSPLTTPELLEALASRELAGAGIALVQYGERSAELVEGLRDRGAHVFEVCLYEWALPEDTGPLRTLVRDLVAGRLDAVAFTSQVQARHLFQMAREEGQLEELTKALQTQVVVASVAPTCSGALEALGVTPHVIPEHSKMGPLVQALTRHFEARRR
jgi:uroporphyrinogen-III synthase